MKSAPRHPTQPLVRDARGVVRFRPNPIVQLLFDNGPFDMNKLATMGFSDEDRAHFAQLIGYSVSGWGDLSYVADGCPDLLAEVDKQAEALRDEADAPRP